MRETASGENYAQRPRVRNFITFLDTGRWRIMEATNGSGTGPPDAQSLNDIHNYLENFNKEISDPGGQTYIITTNADSNFPGGGQQVMTIGEPGAPPVLQSEGQGNRLGTNGETDAPTLQAEIPMVEAVAPQVDMDQPLLTPAAPTLTGQQDDDVTPQLMQTGGQEMQQEGLDSSDTAVQMLASVAATSIPQARPEMAVRQDNPQMVAIQNEEDSSQPQIVEAQMVSQEQPTQEEAIQQKDGDGANSGNAYQTVTIIPSAVAQGGEVSYVLIVSHPDGEQEKEGDENMDMSVYDFKEEVKGVGNVQTVEEEEEECEEEEDDGTQRKLMRLSPKKSHMMQAQLMCNYCNYTSPKRYLLTRHMKTHSEERPHKCNICDRCFKTIASLQNHINTHTGVRPHKCKECDSAFTTSGELVRHVRYRHTYEKPHKCPECDYSSVELSKLKRHIRSHTGERPYQCPHCTYASPDTYKLKRHLRIHTGEKPYECEICHARFTQSNSLKAHKLIHTGNKPVFQCELCPTTCGRKTDLKIHVQKLHTSDQPLQCKKCGKSFPDRYTYKIHVKTHEGEKCFKCELCPYAALSQRHLESHILTHTGEKPFQCDECEQSFRQKQLLRRHKNLYHTPDYIPPVPRDKRHRCQECPKSFAHHGNLLRHMQLHDPDNPDYHVKGEEYSEDEEEEEEDEDDMLDEGQTVIQEGQPPQQVQVLMTEDGEHATQILLQMVPHMGQQNAQPGEMPVQMAVETPGEEKVGIMVIQQEEQQQEVVTVAQIPAPPRRSGRMLQPKMEKVDDDETGLRKRPADEQEMLLTPSKRIKKLEMTNPEDIEEERRREEQKRKDIETCFGFDMEEGDQVAQ